MKNLNTLEWNDAQVIEITSLWAAGFTAEQIGRQMHTSRSAVCGKVRRLMLPLRVTHIGERKPVVKVEPVPKAPPPPPMPEPMAIGPIGDFPDAGTCRYIAGDPGSHEWQCCGAEAVRYDIPWCEHHFTRVYQPAPKRERRAA